FLNSYARHGGRPGVTSDFGDATRYGTARHITPAHPVVCYNRRAGAKNVVLWPLTGYHDPFLPTYLSEAPLDHTPFADKSDRCVWRTKKGPGGGPAQSNREVNATQRRPCEKR
ncbi:MAG: hypothetical protein AAGP08_16210, partial [Pseudomonadota bacterium]